MSKLALRFISGKHKGNEFLLPASGQLYVGRSSEIDLVLMEDMVSRKHAQITVENGTVSIEDLGSTNGTFVNGERISKCEINPGDRVLIGTSIMKLVETDSDAKTTTAGMEIPVQQPAAEIKRATSHANRSMSGTISEVPLPDLIQLFSTSKKTGTLIVRGDEAEGKIHLEKGKIIYSSVSSSPGLSPMKAVFRILAWQEGTFELVGPEHQKFPETIDMSTEHILMEGLRQIDEIRHMQPNLPPPETELVVSTPLLAKLSDLDPKTLDIFQLVYNYGNVGKVTDNAGETDLDVANIINDLLENGYISKL